MLSNDSDWEVISAIVNNAIPQADLFGNAISVDQSPLSISSSQNVTLHSVAFPAWPELCKP